MDWWMESSNRWLKDGDLPATRCSSIRFRWLTICASRVSASVRLIDILCGLAIGAVVGVVVYLIYIRMYYRISPKIKYISNQYTSTGYDYDDVDKIMTVVIFTLIMVVFYATCQMANL
jgi:undecaprenyl-diphosphatase